ncbi:tyrosine-type recombinase/integrase [Pseudolabrys sp.]|uniref:tyrosine-type recombinase/integrase n=1 Tax=Pseudolabrys sp. TaxID=1960880 RepID=UPI003D0BF75F
MATIRRRGQRWQVQVRRKGSPPLSKSFHQRRDAEAWARMMEVQADRRDLPPDLKVLDGLTLGSLVERYRDEITIHHRGSHTEKIVLNAFLRDQKALCARPVGSLTAKDFAAYRDERLKTVSQATVRRQFVPLKHLFKVARRDWGLPIDSPLQQIAIQDNSARRERRLRKGELDRLLRAAESRHSSIVGRIIIFAIETGMRRGEILAMRWRDIDFAEPSLLIPSSKNGHSRVIPLTPRALIVLTPHSGSLVFPLSANAFRLSWERVKERAKIPDLHFHDLRHEAISRFFERGLTVPEVSLISGHRDPRMLFRYAHAMRDTVRHKLSQYDEARRSTTCKS